MNKRVFALLGEIKREIFSLERILEDLEERSSKETFQKALELFEKGWRLQNWGAILTDTDQEIELSGPSDQYDCWYDGGGRNTDEAFKLIGVENTNIGEEILHYLSDLTEEE